MKTEIRLSKALESGSKDKVNQVFESIYLNYFKLGIFIARQYLNEQESIEIVDEAFVSFFEKMIKERKCEIKNIKQYLCTSIKNASIKRVKEINSLFSFDEEINYLEEKEIIDIDNPLKDLSKLEQYIISEHVLLDKTFKEIGLELNKSTNTIKSIYRRGCLKARKQIK